MLPGPVLKKLIRDTFGVEALASGEAMRIPEAQHHKWLELLLQRLKTQERVMGWVSKERTGDLTPPHITLEIHGPTGGRDRADWYQVQELNTPPHQGLYLIDSAYRRRTKHPPIPVRDIGQLEAFVAAVLARQDQDHLRDKKTEKVASFRKQGLTARLTELSTEHNFAFAIGENTRDILLSIRVNGRKTGFHFQFRKTKLDAMLDHVPELVNTLKTMQSLGITFRTNNDSWKGRQCEWIEPSLSDEEQTASFII